MQNGLISMQNVSQVTNFAMGFDLCHYDLIDAFDLNQWNVSNGKKMFRLL